MNAKMRFNSEFTGYAYGGGALKIRKLTVFGKHNA